MHVHQVSWQNSPNEASQSLQDVIKSDDMARDFLLSFAVCLDVRQPYLLHAPRAAGTE